MAEERIGRCLCGAVEIRAFGLSDTISACHCEMCTRWSGGVQMGIEAPEGGVTISGPVKTYMSSSFAERAWCDICGSALWLRNVAGHDVGSYELVPGLFDNAGDAKLKRIVYADCAPAGFALAGDVQRISKADYEKEFDHV